MSKCPWCDYSNEDIKNSLRIHASKSHQKSSRELKEALGILPEPFLCECGCGEFTKPNKTGGYNRFIIGHSNRVNNNWGHNPEARKKSVETRRKNGTLGFQQGNVPWNSGMTRESNEEYNEICAKAFDEKNTRDKRSTGMKLQWKNNNLFALTGSSHSQWKGGTSPISALCHGSNRLYKEWKYPALKEADFKCVRCSSAESLHVHHCDVRMAEIIKMCRPRDIGDREPTWEETTSWVEAVIDWHVENKPGSEVLCERCHSDEHPSLNFSKNIFE
jgi:hypothetical protein